MKKIKKLVIYKHAYFSRNKQNAIYNEITSELREYNCVRLQRFFLNIYKKKFNMINNEVNSNTNRQRVYNKKSQKRSAFKKPDEKCVKNSNLEQ